MQFQRDQRQIFSIRKFKAYGATSVLLGLMILGVNDKALAEQIAKVQVSPESGEATQATSPTTSATLETDNLVISQATGSAVVVKENDAHRLEPVRQKALKDLEALKGDLDHESYVSYSNQIKSATDIDVFASIIKRAKANADEQKAVKLANPAKKATVADEDTSNLSYKERLESTRAKVLSQLYALKGDLSADAYASYQRQLTNTTDVALLDRILERAQKSLVQSDASQPQKAEATVASDSTNRQSLLNESTVSESTELIDLLDKAEDKQAAVRLFFETQLNFDKAKALELFNLVNVDYNTATSKEVHEAIVLAMAEMKNKPQSRVRRARAAGSESDLALTPTVKFIDLRDGSELTPEKVLDGQYGDDIRVNAEVTFPSSATDKQVTFNFAPFVKVKAHSVVDLEQLKEPGKVQVNKEPLAAANGKQYHLLTTLEPAKPGLAEVIYKFKDNVLKTTVSLTMEVEPGAFVTGYAKDGQVSGVTKGIEKSPLVVANIENIAQGEKKTSQNEIHKTSILLKKFQKPSVAPDGALFYSTFDTRAASISEQRYTNLNGYTAKTTFHYGTILNGGDLDQSSPSYFDEVSFEVVLPHGVTLLRVETGTLYQKDIYPETAFQMVPQPQSDGTTLVKVSTKNPIMVDRYSKLYLVTKFDPNQRGKVVGEEETVSLVIQKPKLTLRNYSPEDNLLQKQSPYQVLNLNIERNRPEGENVISRKLYYTISRDGVADYNELRALGALPHTHAFLNDSDVDSVEKIIEVEPTAHVVLKGFHSDFLKVTGQNNPETFNIEVKTKESGVWRSHTVKKNTYYDVVLLGYSKEDTITGIRRDVGVIKAGEFITGGYISNNDVFIGRFAETSPKDQVVETIKLTLSDKALVRPDTSGYSEPLETPPHYHPPISFTIGVDVRERNKLDNVYTTVEVNKREIKQGETARITYTIGSERYGSEWGGMSNVKKIRSISLVLPKADIDLPTSAIRLRNEKGQYFVASSAERDLSDGKRLYTFNLDNVTDDNNIVGWVYTLGGKPSLKRIIVEVDVENKRLKDDYLLQLNRSIFVQTEDAAPNVRQGTVRGEDPYNIYNDLENDHNVFTNLATDLAVNLKVVDKLLATTKAKTTGSDFELVNAKNALNISDTNQSATVRVDLTNNQDVDAGQVIFYIPVPKQGQNWGTSLQDKAFDYTLHLSKAVSSTYPEFTTKFDVDYATVDPAQLTGAINYSHDRLSRLSYSKPSDLTNVNLIRVKAKSDQLFPKKTTVDLNFDYTVNQGTVTDGKENGFRGLYYSDMGSYAGVSETPTVNINITLGAKKLQVFNDANDDDQKQPTESSLEAKINVVDTENQLSYNLTSLSNDSLLISKLVSGRKYTVTIENPDSNTYRFVEGVKGATNVKFTKERVTFDMIPDVNDGLKNIETITVPMTTQKTTYTFKKVNGLAQNKNSIGFFNDNVTPPSPTPGIGMTFAGWKDDASSEVASSKGIQALTYGTSPKSYTGLFAEHKETVTANLVWQNGPEAHPEVQLELVKLHNGTQTVVNTQTLTNGTNSYTWRDLPVAENGTAVTYLVRQKGDLENYRESLRSGNRVTKAVASEAELLKQVQRTKANVSVNVADTSHTLTLAYVSPKKTYNTTVNVTGGPGIATFPKTITLTLKRGNNETVATKQVTITGTSTLQQVDFGSHDINDATGNAYTYTVDSTGLEHYRLTKEGQGLTALKFTYSRTQAQDTRLNNPRAKVLVENPNALSSTEIQQVKNAIMETNEDLAPRQITIAANGEATIMFSDKSSKTMAPEVTVVQKESAKYVPQKPAKAILVRNLSQLTQEEQEQVKAAVQTQNRDNLPDSAEVSVDAQGKVTITYVDQTKDFIQASETVKLADASKTPAVKPARPVPVANPASLTEPEKQAVKEAVVAANPGKNITVDNVAVTADGTVTVTHPDGSKTVLPKADAVKQSDASKTPAVKPARPVPVANPASLTEPEKQAVKEAVVAANPGKNITVDNVAVTADGTVTVTHPDGSKTVLPKADAVKQSDASKTPAVKPARPVPVANPASLTEPEKQAVKEAVVAANPGKNITVDNVAVTADGTVTVTHPDGSKTVLPKADAVKQSDASKTPAVKPARPVPVANPASLTEPEKQAVKEAVVAANPGKNITVDNVAVTADGTVTVTHPDGSKTVLPKADAVKQSDASKTPAVKPARPVPVANPASLTEPEKQAVKEAVVAANPGKNITVDNVAVTADGTVTVTHPDGSKTVLPKADAVKQSDASKTPAVKPARPVPVANPASLTEPEKQAVKEAVVAANPGKNITVDNVAVTADGTVTVTHPDGSKTVLPKADAVKQSDASKTPAVKPARPVPVANPASLTEPEKQAVKEAVVAANPGKNITVDNVAVTADGTVTVTHPDGSKTVLPKADAVKQSDASKTPAVKPARPVPVANPASLTEPEKQAVKEAVVAANPGKNITVDNVAVTADGTVTVTHPDGSKTVLPKADAVKQSDASKTPAVKPARPVPVANPASLTEPEKQAVKEAVVAANPGKNITVDNVAVTADGTVTVTHPDGSKTVLPKADAVKQSDASKTPAVKPARPVPVANPASLTEPEKQAVKEAVVAANPGKNITVDNVAVTADGTVTVTHPDGSKTVLPKADAVKQSDASKTPAVKPARPVPVANPASLTEPEKQAVKEAVVAANPGKNITVDNVAVTADGTVTVTHPDGSKTVLPKADAVKQSDASKTPAVKPARPVPVANPASLTEPEKQAVKEAVVAANPGKNITVDNVAVTADGTVTVTHPDGSKTVLPKADAVKQSDASKTPAVKPARPVPVANPASLTEPEKQAVKEAVVAANPGKNITVDNVAVTADGTVTVTHPDGSKTVLPKADAVKQSDASKTPAVKPARPVPVANPASLTEPEKQAVKEAVVAANPGKNITVDNVAVTADGTVTVTHPDGSKTVLPKADAVKQSDASKTPAVKPARPVPVANPASLTEPEKQAVKEAVVAANPGKNITVDNVAVTADGTVTVTHPDGSKTVLPKADAVKQSDASKTPAVKPARPVPVANPASLTEPEKQAVKEAVVAANPGKNITVDNVAVTADGTVTVTHPDGSKTVLPKADAVKQSDASKTPINNPASIIAVKNPKDLTQTEKELVEKAVKVANPKLGEDVKISVAEDGTVTITFPDGTETQIPSLQTVKLTSQEDTGDTTVVKDPAGTVTVTDPNGTATTVDPKVPGTTTTPGGTTVTVGNDNKVTVKDPKGNVTVVDPTAGTTTTTPVAPATGTDTTVVKDPAGTVTVTDPNGTATTVDPKVPGTTTTPGGTTVTVGNDNKVTVKDPKGNVTVVDPTAGTTTTTPVAPATGTDTTVVKDPAGTVTVTDPNGTATTVDPKVPGTTTTPGGTTVTVGNDNKVTVKDPKGNVTVVDPTAGTTTTTPVAPATGTDTTVVKDPAGTVTVTDPNGTATTVDPKVPGTTTTPGGTTVTVGNDNKVTVKDPKGNVTVVDPTAGTTTTTPVAPATGTDTTVVKDPAGTVTVTDPNGTATTVDPKVPGTTTTPGGTTVTVGNDGKVTVKDPKGNVTVVDPTAGTTTTTPVAPATGTDTTVVKDPAGTVTVTDPNGTATTVDPKVPGTTTTPGGTTVTVGNDGKVTVKDPKGNVTVVDPTAGTTTTTPVAPATGTDTTVVKDPAGTVTVTDPNGTATTVDPKVPGTTTTPGGTTVTVGNDNKVTVKDPKGNVTVVDPTAGTTTTTPVAPATGTDTTVVKDPAGTVTVTDPNGTATTVDPKVPGTTTTPGGTTVTVGNDNKVTVKDPKGNVTVVDPTAGTTTTTPVAPATGTDTTVVKDPAGTVTVTDPNGTATTVDPKVPGTTTTPGGTTVTVGNDGKVTVKDPKGNVTVVDPTAGTTTTTPVAPATGTDTTVVKDPAGTVTVTDPNGTATTVDPKVPGTTTTPGGTTVTVGNDNKVTVKDPKGNVTVVDPTAGTTTTTPVAPATGTDTTVVKDPAGTVTVTDPNGTATTVDPKVPGTTTTPGGTTVTVGNDNKVTVKDPKGNVTVVDPATGTITTTAQKDEGKAATLANPYQPVVNYAPVDTLSIKQKAKETATLPSTGETNSSLLATYGALGLMAGLGLVAYKKRRDDEA